MSVLLLLEAEILEVVNFFVLASVVLKGPILLVELTRYEELTHYEQLAPGPLGSAPEFLTRSRQISRAGTLFLLCFLVRGGRMFLLLQTRLLF